MQKVDADAIQVGVELRESVEPGFDSAPVVIARPIFADFLHVLEGNPLRQIRNGLQVGPARSAQALFQILEIRVAHMNLEPLDFIAHGLRRQCWLAPYGAFSMMRTSIDSVTAIPTVSPVSSLMRREGPSNKVLPGFSKTSSLLNGSSV